MPLKNKIAISLIALLCASSAFAEQQLSLKEPVVVNGDKVEYFHDKKKVTGEGNISITYKDVVMTCDKVTVYLDTREAIAEGNVRITQQDAYFTGDKMNYNFDTRKGTVINGYVDSKPFYGKAEKVDKEANKDIYALERGYVTTCDYDEPHYRVQARRVKIYLEDKVVAQHIIFFLRNIPVFYFPYYVQPLKDTKSNFTVMAGRKKDWGYYALTSYRYHIGEKWTGDLLLDYRAKEGMGLAGGANQYFDFDELGKASAKFYYTVEGAKNDTHPGQINRRYRYQYRQRWNDIGGDPDTYANIEFNLLSDQYVIRDYFYNEYAELGDNPDNYISLITQKKDYSTEFLIRKRFNKFNNVVERLPEFSIQIPNNNIIKGMPVYYEGNASATYLQERFAATVPEQKKVDIIRIDTTNKLSYAARLFKSLSTTPYVSMENTYYSRNLWGNTNQIRGIFNAGVDNSMKFYKIYDYSTKAFGLDINKIRHVITPSAGYYYTHQPTISPDNLNQFDEIDARVMQNGINFTLENKLQTKRVSGKNMQSVDLARFVVNTNYMFRLKKGNTAINRQKFQDVNMKLELSPYPWMYTLSTMTVNTKRYSIETFNNDIVANGGDKWSVAFGSRYESVTSGKSSQITFDAMYKLNEKWRLRTYQRYNLFKGFEEQEFTVYRDLHCWLAEFTYNLREGEQNLWLVFTLKAFPEYPIGLRRIYSRPQYGSTGSGRDDIALIGGSSPSRY